MLKWYANRLKAFEKGELTYRVFQQLQINIFDRFDRCKKFAQRDLKRNSNHLDLHVPPSYEKKTTVSLRIFSETIEDVTEISNWRFDYKNNIVSPLKYRRPLKPEHVNTIGDPKYILEQSRMHHLVWIACISVAQERDELAILFEKHIVDWLNQNPYLRGINWHSGIEMAIRSINLILAVLIFEQRDRDFGKKGCISDFLCRQMHYLERHLSLYSSANNHLLAEISGLIWIHHFYDCKKSYQKKIKYIKMYLAEMEKQIHLDGFNREQSIHYHAFTLELLLLNMRIIATEIPNMLKYCEEMAAKMSFALHCFSNCEGLYPQIGDGDDGCVLRLNEQDNNKYYSSLVNLVSLVVDKGNNISEECPIDDRAFLFHGAKPCGVKKRTPEKNSCVDQYLQNVKHVKYLNDSGYLFVKSKEMELIVDMAPLGYMGTAAHGHADALQILLSVKGFWYLIDSGASNYFLPDKYRNYFRGTSAHNTVRIGCTSQSEIGGRMLWLKRADVQLLDFEEKGDGCLIRGSHDGYQKQGFEAKHIREIRVDYESKTITLSDTIETSSTCHVEIFFHLNAKVTHVESNDKSYRIWHHDDFIDMQLPLHCKCEQFEGDSVRPLGWSAPEYDQLIPTKAIVCAATIDKAEVFITKISY